MCKCEMIKDLLPLYEEDLVSEQTKQEIEEHLKVALIVRQYMNPHFQRLRFQSMNKRKKG